VAVRFEITNERITIRQSRRVLRAMPIVVAVLLAGGIVALIHDAAQENGPKLQFVLPAVLLGWAIIFFALRPMSVTIDAVLDRAAGRIEVRGRGWLMRAWHVDRPLREVADIELRSRNVFYGPYVARTVTVFAVFTDGSAALIWSPAFATPRTIAERVGALRILTGR
jgi:hypothetical protein